MFSSGELFPAGLYDSMISEYLQGDRQTGFTLLLSCVALHRLGFSILLMGFMGYVSSPAQLSQNR